MLVVVPQPSAPQTGSGSAVGLGGNCAAVYTS